jgi:hypothetical protein
MEDYILLILPFLAGDKDILLFKHMKSLFKKLVEKNHNRDFFNIFGEVDNLMAI